MQRGSLDDLLAFVAVARERSFTNAAAKLGASQSALSHTIRELEERLGVRLLTRTTRSVSPTEAVERLLHNIGPRFDEIQAELAAIRELREKPAGTIRITATEFAIDTVLLPKLAKLLGEYPDIRVEMIIDYGLTDIVAQQYDAGVRSGVQVAKDMIAVRIGPDMRMAVVGTPAYFKTHPEPKKPQDLLTHNCINLRLPAHGNVYAWEFERGSRELRVRRGGAAYLQRHCPTAERGTGRLRSCLRAGRLGRTPCRQGPPQTRACGVVSTLFGLPPLLSEPPAVFRRLRAHGRCAPPPLLGSGQWRRHCSRA